MKCVYCGSPKTIVIDKRTHSSGLIIRRRRECLDCKKRFTTFEKIREIAVIKKNKEQEPFDKEKILAGLKRATVKRGISEDRLKKITDQIEGELRSKSIYEVESKDIGDIVLKYLKKLDEVAYVRFASVYQEFEDVGEFTKLLKKIKRK